MKISFKEMCATLAPTVHPLLIKLSIRRLGMKAQKKRTISSWVKVLKATGMVRMGEEEPVQPSVPPRSDRVVL